MTAKKIPVVAWRNRTAGGWFYDERDPREAHDNGKQTDALVLATDYEAAIAQMKSVTEYALSLEKLIDWDEMAQHYGVSVAKHNLGKRPTPRRPQLSDGVKSTKE